MDRLPIGPLLTTQQVDRLAAEKAATLGKVFLLKFCMKFKFKMHQF